MPPAKSPRAASSQSLSPPPPAADRRRRPSRRYSHSVPQKGYGYHGSKITLILAVFDSPDRGWRTLPLTYDSNRADDRELWTKIRDGYQNELQSWWRRVLQFKKLKRIVPIEFTRAGVPKQLNPADGTASREFMHAFHHPRAFRSGDHAWVDWFADLKTDPDKSYGLDFIEGLWAEKLAALALAFFIAIIVVSIVWCIRGGVLQTVFTVMGFVLSGVAALIALLALYYQVTLPN